MFHLLAQAVYMGFYRMGAHIRTIAPNFLQQIILGDDFIFVFIQKFDNRHFFFGQLYGFAITLIVNFFLQGAELIAIKAQIAGFGIVQQIDAGLNLVQQFFQRQWLEKSAGFQKLGGLL